MAARDPFLTSLLARSAWQRLAFALPVILCLWLAIVWAISLP
ncbi:hypothetical protein [Beijerinckia mobilis]|nr:hypothetical protein [Beijerinckia mobilis]